MSVLVEFFHLIYVHIIFRSVWVVAWPPFGKELISWLTICSLCTVTICNYSFVPFLVMRAGFGFCLPQLLIIAYLLLFNDTVRAYNSIINCSLT